MYIYKNKITNNVKKPKNSQDALKTSSMPFLSLLVQKKWKIQFQTLGESHLKSYSRTRCHIPTAMSLPSLVGITIKNLEKSEKCYFRPVNGRHFPQSRSFEVKFADIVPLTPSNVPAKFCSNNQSRFGEKCTNVISDP